MYFFIMQGHFSHVLNSLLACYHAGDEPNIISHRGWKDSLLSPDIPSQSWRGIQVWNFYHSASSIAIFINSLWLQIAGMNPCVFLEGFEKPVSSAMDDENSDHLLWVCSPYNYIWLLIQGSSSILLFLEDCLHHRVNLEEIFHFRRLGSGLNLVSFILD